MWDLGHREEAQRPLHETMRLAEARLERHAPGGSMPSETPKHCKIHSRRDAPKMAILEAPCAQNAPGRSTMRPPEALLRRNPTWESPRFSGLTVEFHCYGTHNDFIHIFIVWEYIIQDNERGGLSLRGVAVTTETATTAETAKTVKTVTVVSGHCIL